MRSRAGGPPTRTLSSKLIELGFIVSIVDLKLIAFLRDPSSLV
jgi:hypothetical protein